MKKQPHILWFDEIGIDDVPIVGGKNASLGEMYRNLRKKAPLLHGFAITSFAYKYVLEKNNASGRLKAIMKDVNPNDPKSLKLTGKKAREVLLACEFPPDLKQEIIEAYRKLSKGKKASVAVRSSATAEDLPTASFAGQQETFLNISGEKEVLEACKRCFASLFTDRAIAYRCENKIDHLKVSLSVGIQKMVRSDLACAGVMFTLDPDTGFRNTVFINASYGLGESVVQGMVNPDEFYVFKPTLNQGFKPIIDKVAGNKETKIIYGKKGTKKIAAPLKERQKFCIDDEDVLKLAKWAALVEEYYSQKNGKWTPMDLEWAKDGETGELFIVQARPETVQSAKNPYILEEYQLQKKGKALATGKSVGNKIGQGKARIIKDIKDMKLFKTGEILVTDITDPDWVPIMRIASAIVTNRGGRTSHAAIVSRELGLPCIVGTNNGTEAVKTGQNITVDCTDEEQGVIYEGLLPFNLKKIDVRKIAATKTKIMVNVGYPDEAVMLSMLPTDGVGLAREEFIVSEYIRIHPMALVHFDLVKDPKIKKEIQALTVGYTDKRQFFVDKLASGAAMIAAAFYPRDVILRFSDFKTNEYVNLIGGKYFEPKEENPMIGWRGASRYYSEGYKEGFALECAAIKKVREEFGLGNLKVMVPVCRTVEEGRRVLEVMAKNGLRRGEKGLEVYVMCEVPSNAILADEFAEIFDGFSIGSNDLTQLTLGIDRDNERLAEIYDERNEAVKQLIKLAIIAAKKHKRKIGICGEAPSNYPEFATFLVDLGIDSISLSPDAVMRVKKALAKYENSRIRR
jgi:pyruvate, water dikinase